MTLATAPRTTERLSLIAELTRIQQRLEFVTGNGQDNLAAVGALVSAFDTRVTPRISCVVRAGLPDTDRGEVTRMFGVAGRVIRSPYG